MYQALTFTRAMLFSIAIAAERKNLSISRQLWAAEPIRLRETLSVHVTGAIGWPNDLIAS